MNLNSSANNDVEDGEDNEIALDLSEANADEEIIVSPGLRKHDFDYHANDIKRINEQITACNIDSKNP